MSAEDSKKLVNTMIEAFNTRQFDTLAGTIVSPNLVYQQNGNSGGREKWLEDFRNCAVSFPDVHLAVKSQKCVNEEVITDLEITGTHLGPLGEMPPTGKSFKVNIHLSCHVKNGLILDWIEQVDQMAMAQQLGLMPSEVTDTIDNR